MAVNAADMNALVFDSPWILLGFSVFIPLLLSDYVSERRKRIHKRLPKNLRLKLITSRFFFRLFLACFIVALAGPRWGIGQTAGEYSRALDAVIALDVSRSMELPDGGHGGISRKERGVAIVREAVEAMPGMRLGMAVSRSRGILAIPLTWDSSAVYAFLEAIDGSSITGWGTNLESLVDAAAGAFQSSHHSSRVILLVSDGEELSGSLRAALDRCSRNRIAVTAIAVGSDDGMPLPGNGEITSSREPEALRTAARETGGAFIDGNRDDAAEALIAHLRSLAAEARTGEGREERKARWFIFAIAAIMSFGASKLSLLRMGIGNGE